MFSTLFTIALLASSALADFAVNSPTLTQCKDAKISWEKTAGPYNLIVVAAKDPCGDALVDLGDHEQSFLSWKVNLPAGSKVQLSVEDKNGEEAWSGDLTVEESDDVSCLPASLRPTSTQAATTKSSSAFGSTVVVTPTTTINAVVPATTSTDVVPGPVGAAGASPFGSQSGAISARHAGTPLLLIGALSAILALSI